MEELIVKMVGCLLVALALGFLFGWFIKRAFAKGQYEPRIEELEQNCARDKNMIVETEKETALIKEQFLTTKGDLDTSTLRIDNLEDYLTSHKTEIVTLKSTLKEKEAHIEEQIEVNDGLNTKISYIQTQLDTKTKETNNHSQELLRVKEHHTLLQNQVTSLSHERDLKSKELDTLSIMIDKYKVNEQKLLSTQSTHKNQLTELNNTINEKNIAALQLTQKVKEIDILNLKNNELTNNLKNTEMRELKYKNSLEDFKKKIIENESVAQKELTTSLVDEKTEGFFAKLEHSVKGNMSIASDKFNASSTKEKIKDFDFKSMVKKALHSVSKTGEEINKKADKVIRDYQNKK